MQCEAQTQANQVCNEAFSFKNDGYHLTACHNKQQTCGVQLINDEDGLKKVVFPAFFVASGAKL